MPESGSDLPLLLATVGAVLLLTPALDGLAHRTRLPRVSLLLLLGVLAGPLVLDVLPEAREQWYPALSEVALAMVGFVLGHEFTLANLRRHGRAVVLGSAVVVLTSAVLVGGGLVLLGAPLPVALVLATASAATDPAAVDSVAREGGARGPMTSLLRGVVALDDVWGILLFGGVLAVLSPLLGEASSHQGLVQAAREIGGSTLLGLALGLPMAAVTGRLRPGEPTRLEALGFVLLCSGLASLLEVSYLLAAVVMGATVANLARHHDVSFRELEHIQTPFLVLFFVLSGSSAHLQGLGGETSWALVLGYIVLRTAGRLVGGWVGARLAGLRPGLDLGLALLPQAGVALGMTLVAVERFPALEGAPLPVVIVGTVVFETVGPVLTRRALARAGELSA